MKSATRAEQKVESASKPPFVSETLSGTSSGLAARPGARLDEIDLTARRRNGHSGFATRAGSRARGFSLWRTWGEGIIEHAHSQCVKPGWTRSLEQPIPSSTHNRCNIWFALTRRSTPTSLVGRLLFYYRPRKENGSDFHRRRVPGAGSSRVVATSKNLNSIESANASTACADREHVVSDLISTASCIGFCMTCMHP
ncbi:hypothetical protein EVAR_101888_1 [Eumeta japonica]|uniref:Uncharacterized protein n=1 Tax=Eumeta variegata TaxID=151549 RepID=A0A4C1SMZ4_EUMVA|nr:hypothetical protein EVAR_101888_1 [Eumeta japonica]